MKRGLLEAGVLLVVAFVLAQLVAAIWTGIDDGDWSQHFGVSLAIIGVLIGLVGGDMIWSRISTIDERAFLGYGPERYQGDPGEGLTPVGRFLFVGAPLFVLGLIVMSR